jgi:serine/arginine repetitive matrix protein 2
MRNTMSIRSRAQPQDQLRTLSPQPQTPPQRDSMPTIRLISAAPTAAGSAPGLGDPFIDTSFSSPSVTVSPPAPLAPKNDSQAPRKRLVPKKSKLGLLVSGKRSKTPENNDLSDVARRVGVNTATDSVTKSGFEIYVDPTAQSEVSEVLMVKKKKSRAALSALKWGTLAEVTNSAPSKDSTRGVRLKNEDKEKWWSIGRGRKDSKDMKILEKENLRMDRMCPHFYCKLRLFILDFVQLLELPRNLWHLEHAFTP